VISVKILGLKFLRYIADSAPRGSTRDEGLAPRTQLTGVVSKAPQAASVKSRGGEC
jgi:hypothetical protein